MGRLSTISAGESFVDVLAMRLLQEREALAETLIFVPSARAVVALRMALLRANGGRPLLLPRIEPLGEIDAELSMADGIAVHEQASNIPPPLTVLRRLSLLVQEILKAQGSSGTRDMKSGISLEQALQLAESLSSLFDQLTRAEVSPAALATLQPDEFSEHWQKTLDFLAVVTETYPALLATEGMLDPVAWRQQVMDALSAHWQRHPPSYPVIAAGTTGSIPATARLLKVIAALPLGEVILPGLDREMEEEAWRSIPPSHAQYGLKHVLETIGIERQEVGVYGSNGHHDAAAFWRAVLHPVALPELSTLPDIPETLTVLEGDDQAHEAALIVLVLRGVLESPHKTAMLVTHDRALARRVAHGLKRYQVTIDDSAGMPLSQVPASVFLRLLLDWLAVPDAVQLLAILKHPFCLLGHSPQEVRAAARTLERLVLRPFAAECRTLQQVMVRMDQQMEEDEKNILRPFFAVLMGFQEALDGTRFPLATLLQELLRVSGVLARNEVGQEVIWQQRDGMQVAAWLSEIAASGLRGQVMEKASAGAVLTTLLATVTYHTSHAAHPRLALVSPLEARMQHADVVILGGLSEGIWPTEKAVDPWLSLPMQRQLGLPTVEHHIGQMAHDFMMLAPSAEVFLTRAKRVGQVDTMPSRWWMRMRACIERASDAYAAGLRARAQLWQGRWLALNAEKRSTSYCLPSPTPPVATRPNSLAITDIERLIRNPYAIYARYILRLKALKPLVFEPGPADFGSALHLALEMFTAKFPGPLPHDAEAELTACFHTAFAELLHNPAVERFWSLRLAQIARSVIALERERRQLCLRVDAEQSLTWTWQDAGEDFTLKGRIDRIERRRDGSVAVVDYKTGSVPKPAEISSGVACQLPLAAVLLKHQGESAPLAALEYWHLSGKREEKLVREAVQYETLPEIVTEAETMLREIVVAYRQPDMPYAVTPDPAVALTYDDYAHLARTAELTGGAAAGEEFSENGA